MFNIHSFGSCVGTYQYPTYGQPRCLITPDLYSRLGREGGRTRPEHSLRFSSSAPHHRTAPSAPTPRPPAATAGPPRRRSPSPNLPEADAPAPDRTRRSSSGMAAARAGRAPPPGAVAGSLDRSSMNIVLGSDGRRPASSCWQWAGGARGG